MDIYNSTALKIIIISWLFISATVLTIHRYGSYEAYSGLSCNTTVQHVFYNLYRYGRNYVAPAWLNVRYPELLAQGRETRDPAIIAFYATILVGVLSIWQYRKGNRLYLWAYGWFFIHLAPCMGVITISTSIADRYQYIAGVGVWVMFALCVKRLLSSQQ
jgi:hypothetical protein